jgi:tRNA pseudouridine55 synthase
VKKIIVLNKKEGQTPLQALEFFRMKNKKYKDLKMTYAGRLDPMGSCVLLILAGEETKNKEKYLVLNKEYEFEVLFGFATDTYDVLGILQMKDFLGPRKGVSQTLKNLSSAELQKEIKKNLRIFTGKFIQKYPIYSSKTVKGKQLFTYARAGEEVEIPSREVIVKSLKLLKIRKITGKKLLENIEKRVKKVDGDFRQKEILKIWRKELHPEHEQGLPLLRIASFKIKCSSGTYVRGIANSLGNNMGILSLAFKIKRTKIGKYML